MKTPILSAQPTGSRTAVVLKELEAGVSDLIHSSRYQDYLHVMARFHRYSWSNALLIQLQYPDATRVAGFSTWVKMGRRVNTGEHGIRILAPAVQRLPAKSPPDDKAGDATTVVSSRLVRYFRVVHVFDVMQTSGSTLPELAGELEGDFPDYDVLLQGIRAVATCPVEFGPIPGGAKGYFSPSENHIRVKEGMSEIQSIKTLLHEVAHERLHRDSRETRATAELEAESIAFTTASFFGLDTSDYSFAYLAGWSSDAQLTELRKCLPVIQKASDALITELEAVLARSSMPQRRIAA